MLFLPECKSGGKRQREADVETEADVEMELKEEAQGDAEACKRRRWNKRWLLRGQSAMLRSVWH